MIAEHPSITALCAVAELLGELRDDLVFVGGAVVPLLVTDPAAMGLRPTRDIDAIVEVSTWVELQGIQDKLKSKGFSEDSSSEVICRWKSGELRLDLMPVEPKILGFSNQWYEPACHNCMTMTLHGRSLRIISAPYFLGTKIQAFVNRGNGDYMSSPDLEDIIAVLDGRSVLVDEISETDADLRTYLGQHFAAFLGVPEFVQAIAGFLNPDAASQGRRPQLELSMAQIASFG